MKRKIEINGFFGGGEKTGPRSRCFGTIQHKISQGRVPGVKVSLTCIFFGFECYSKQQVTSKKKVSMWTGAFCHFLERWTHQCEEAVGSG